LQARALVLVAALVVLSATFLPVQAGTGTPAFANYVSPANLPNNANSGEPSIGVNPITGAAFFQAYTSTHKVTWNAAGTATWTPVTAITSLINIDPILFTDQQTGRTFAGGLGVECSLLQYTDNDGGSWVPVGNACPYPAADHPSVGGGPWHQPAPLGSGLVYPNSVYVCQQSGTDRCVVSKDGGLTFGLPIVGQGDCHSFHGHIKVSADGVAYLPNAYCGANQGGFVTQDNGGTWLSYHIPGSTVQSNGGGFDPTVATTPDNTLYESWGQGTNNHAMFARSLDHGATWDRLTDLSTNFSPAITASTFHAIVAGDNGRVAIAYLGSTDGNGQNPFGGNFVGTWDLFISFSYDGGLTWQTVKATTDPVQRGCIYDVINNVNCHRNLLDFMDATVAADGRVLVAYADGCVSAACVAPTGTIASSSAAKGVIARQTAGMGMYAAFDSSW
jgi:hypothetical protein